jgi:pimeloyl-ACP methyl ester carboxylesterase
VSAADFIGMGVVALLVAAPVPSRGEAISATVQYAEGRPAVKQPYLLAVGGKGDVSSIVLLIPGGGGVRIGGESGSTVPLRPDGFLAMLSDRLGAAALAGNPPDHGELALGFRETAAHAADVGSVVDALAGRYPGVRIFLLGISNGAVSASFVGGRLGDKVSGVILASASNQVFENGSAAAIKVPVLVVHHRRDSCLPYRYIADKAKWYPLLLVDDASKPRPGGGAAPDCGGTSAHVFSGRETEVVQAIADWIVTGKSIEEIK